MDRVIDGVSVVIGALSTALLLMFAIVVQLYLRHRRLYVLLHHRCRDCGAAMIAEHYCSSCEYF